MSFPFGNASERIHAQQPWIRRLGRVAALACFVANVTASALAADLIELPRITNGAAEAQTHERTGSEAPDLQKSTWNDLSLEGTYGYTVSNGTVRIQADRVSNQRAYGTSGTIRLELWGFSTPYGGSGQSGYKLGQTSLGTLSAGWYFYDIDQTVTQLTTLPSGTWYMALIVTEYTGSYLNDGYVSVDWGNFSTPWVIGAPPPASVTVYEFHNTLTNHYFRTSISGEVDFVAAGSAGPGWVRTWDDFKAYAPNSGSAGNDVCRFYSYVSNSHFYTASDVECNYLRYIGSEWNYEGLVYRIQLPSNGSCAAGLRPVYRLYNGRFMFNDSNHRFTTSFSEVERLRSWPNNWQYEGVAFCALN